ncbi:hypothetical protein H1C71_008107 [Ictidomys tridecemlineatus]|nr:hypothetical protein H1C71_008107 [Ictidomys tridecemlineatus]
MRECLLSRGTGWHLSRPVLIALGPTLDYARDQGHLTIPLPSPVAPAQNRNSSSPASEYPLLEQAPLSHSSSLLQPGLCISQAPEECCSSVPAPLPSHRASLDSPAPLTAFPIQAPNRF